MKSRLIYFLAAIIFVLSTSQFVYSVEIVNLSGSWQFRIDPADQGIKGRWYTEDFDKSIDLPGSMAQRGYGNDITVDTPWTGKIVDRSWFTEKRYEKYRQPGNIKIPC